MDTLFFLIQISGLVAIVLWAFRNERFAAPAEQVGLLAMLAPRPAGVPEGAAATGRGGMAAPARPAGGAELVSRKAPPRRRFTAP